MKDERTKPQFFEPSLSENDHNYLKELDEAYLNDYDQDNEETKFKEKDYANLQYNLILFKEGNREATEYIIKAFHRTLHAYANFIVLHRLPYIKLPNKKISIINPSILSFIKLFSGTKMNERFDMKEACDRIYFLFKKYEYGDIYNSLVLALLNMANKYKIITDKNDPHYMPNGTFHVYVKKCFHFDAFYFLKELTKDPLISANLLKLTDDDENDYDTDINNIAYSTISVDEDALEKYNIMIDTIDRQIALKTTDKLTLKEDEVDIYSDESLNFNWINGVTCGSAFKELTPYERELLLLAYAKNQTEDNIAKLYGYSRSAVGSHKRKAIAKLKKTIEQQQKSGEMYEY